MSPLPPQPISPLDGRYRGVVQGLGEHLSEAGLNRARVHVEVEWLLALTERGMFGSTPLEAEQARALRSFASDFGQREIDELAALEATTRHDVKAVEYLVRAELTELGLNAIAELTHFACTSEDINNLSYALTIRAAVREVWLPRLADVLTALRAIAVGERSTPMLAHTHGQPATPTTVGKEFAVFVARLERGIARGEVDPARLTERIRTLPFDLFRHEALMTLQPLSAAAITEIVDEIFLPLVRPVSS